MKNPFSLTKWIESHRDLLKPPVGNKKIFEDSDYIIMAVGGPNERTDFHINETEEFFYQLQGDMFLRLVNEEGKIQELPIKEGEVFLLPKKVPHSPQRSKNSVGLVIEMKRNESHQDGLAWYCSRCHHKLYEEFFHLQNIETDFPAVFERYYQSGHIYCKNCGHCNGRVWN